MNLVNPTALLLAGLAVPIIIFYILKIRLRRVPVSTLLFWQQIFEEKKRRSLWQRLRHLLSLLLQLAFLCLLVLALADPIFRWQQARARRTVIVVDNSASMNAIVGSWLGAPPWREIRSRAATRSAGVFTVTISVPLSSRLIRPALVYSILSSFSRPYFFIIFAAPWFIWPPTNWR